MRTTCPTCETAYTIPDERIGAKGRKVRCTKCGDEWRVTLAVAEAVPVIEAEPVRAAEARPSPAPRPPADAWETFDETEVAAGAGPDVVAAEPPPDDAAAPVEPPAGEPHIAVVAEPPRPRVRIRTRSRFPKIRRETLAKAAARAMPFVGPMVFVAACLVATATFVARQSIVAFAPDLAGLYAALGAPVNLRGLDFGRIVTLREIDNGQPVLVVEGSITNVTKQMREVPALRFALRGPDTQELYAWSIDPKSTTIESGDTIRFRTRLAAPPDQASEVQVRFAERRSQHAGLP